MDEIIQTYKCGEIYKSKTSVYIFVCSHCKEEFDNFVSFRCHTELSHPESIEVNDIKDEIIYTVGEADIAEENEEYKFHEQILIEKYEASIGKDSDDSLQNIWFDEDTLEKEENLDRENHEGALLVKPSNKINYDTAYKIFIDPTQNIKNYLDIDQNLLSDLEKIENDEVHTIHDKNRTNLEDSEEKQTEKKSNSDIDIDKSLQCSFCEKKFKLLRYLQKHEENHQNLKCRFCGKNFKSAIELKNHVRTHTGEKPFQCTQCSAAFAIKRNLDTHIIYKHTEDKPFECRFEGGCGKSFKTDQLRNFHEKRHSQKVEFQCEICGAEFNIKEKFTMHHKTKHMNYSERPHKCSFCDKKFVRKSNLREHERTHTGEKPLKCNQCPRSFAKKSALREHKKLHTGEKKHVCRICEKAFAQYAGYANHMKNHP